MEQLSQRSLIHPEDTSDLLYWAKKWGVSTRQVIDAILETGSLDPRQIKETLKNKNQLNNLFYKIFKLIKHNTSRKQTDFSGFTGLRKVA